MNRFIHTVVSVSFLVAMAHAGPIDPPTGPVDSTYKTLDEVEPRIPINEVNTPGDATNRFIISSRGSYYLTEDLPIIGAKSGIRIEADDVTIDLMGFTLYSSDPLPPGSPPISLHGIVADDNQRENICIRNGNIEGFGLDGIYLEGDNHRLDDLRVRDCVGGGLIVRANGVVTTNCQSLENGGLGYHMFSNCVFVDSVAQGNGGDGIHGGWSVSFENCSSRGNGGDGFYTGRTAVVRGCVADQSTGSGFNVDSGSLVTECASYFNSGRGVLCRSSGSPGTSTLISECAVYQNIGPGIEVARQCVVRDNMCRTNEILVTQDGNRIEGNHVTSSIVGFSVTGEHNIIVRNTATFNGTNYSFAANNRWGEIVDISATGTPVHSGSAASSTLFTTDPWANFSH